MSLKARIIGTGSALPARRVSNAELAQTVDTSDEWIVARTGIRFRHIAGDNETTATLATDASRKALEAAGMAASEVDLIVLATATPDQTFPASATKVQAALGIDDCVAFDVAAVCSGFLYAISVAESMIRSGGARTALVIGSETFSRILDATARKLGLAPEKVIVTVDEHANTSAASVPLALDAAVRDGRIKPGDLIVMEAMGGGFTWGSVLARW